MSRYDLLAIGNALVDVVAPASDAFLEAEVLPKGAMSLIDGERAHTLYQRMGPGVETSGGTAANTSVGLASFGGRSAFIGKVADDTLGEVFTHDLRAAGVAFSAEPLKGGATGRCLVNVTPDAERTMCTFLGASVELTVADVSADQVGAASVLYLEGYLFDPSEARRAFIKAARLARAAGRRIAFSLSDCFLVERHREALLAFVESEVDVLFGNEAEILSLFPGAEKREALERAGALAEIVAVTFGAHGSLILGSGSSIETPADPVEEVVDTTGAGDQYAAGFLSGLAHDRPLAACGALGSLAAGEVITHYGPRPQR
ncbi:MAG: adenosine kinase, partial [Caulobacteraceae bacterium]